MRTLLLTGLLLLASSDPKAQITAPAATKASIVFDVTGCETERIGPFQMPSGNWALVDTIIERMGKEKALEFFKGQLHDEAKSVRFYALIGIHRSGSSDDFHLAVSQVRDETILFQNGCLMVKKPLTEAVLIAVNG